jgi:hypothetical protein
MYDSKHPQNKIQVLMTSRIKQTSPFMDNWEKNKLQHSCDEMEAHLETWRRRGRACVTADLGVEGNRSLRCWH